MSEVVRGRAEIAEALGLSERTVSRLIERGVLPARKRGPFQNSELVVDIDDIDRVRRIYRGEAA
jgi:hypothetical protein